MTGTFANIPVKQHRKKKMAERIAWIQWAPLMRRQPPQGGHVGNKWGSLRKPDILSLSYKTEEKQ